MAPRFVLLSDHGSHGQTLARLLGERGIKLEAVVWHSKPPKDEGRAPLAKARRWLGFWRVHRHFYSSLNVPVLFVDVLNSKKGQRMLEKLAPDYILVGSGTILKPPIIETARCGVFNAHPGLLPWMRGSGVIGHALKCSVPVGATLHYIDAGIDTGNIIERRLLPVMEAQSDLSELDRAAARLAAQMMVEAVEGLVQSGQKPEATAQRGRFPLFRWYDAQERRRLQELAALGRARELFESWKALSSGEPTWALPTDLMEAPVPLTMREI